MNSNNIPHSNYYTVLDICEFKNMLSLNNQKPHQEVIDFQNIFKSSFLSSELFPSNSFSSLSPFRQNKINGMYIKIIENKAIARLLSSPNKLCSFNFHFDGQSCFYVADLIFSDTVFSFKVTNEIDFQGFVSSVIPYNYHLEAGLSFQATGINKFVLIGVQHFHPYDLFIVDLSHWEGPGGLVSGHHECKTLLQQIKESNFVPSRWA